MTTNSLMLEFNFEGNAVRTLERDGNPWFVLADVCRVLEIGNPAMAASRLDDDERATLSNAEGRAGHGAQSFTIINESGLYSLTLTSRKPAAKRFKKWVTGTVLPAIRKDGAYVMDEEKVSAPGATLTDLDALRDQIETPIKEENTTMNGMMFEFDGAPVRAVKIDGEPYFVGRDVADRLGYADPADAMKRHCKGPVKRRPLQTAGGVQAVRVLSEPDVLRLIISSKLPAAERFERWVFETVLPAIRKDGAYVVGEEKVATGEMTEDELLLRAMTILQDKATRLAAERDAAVSRVAKLEPEAGAFTNFLGTSGKLTLRDAAKQLGLGPKDFVSRLIAGGYLFRSSGDLHVKAEYAPAGRGWFETRARSGFGWNSIQVFVTNKGLAAFAKKMMVKVEA